MSRPLVAVSHGTRDPRGQAAIRALVGAVRRRRPDLDVREAFVDVQAPDLGAVLDRAGPAAVVVPLLLAPGHHVHVDVARAVAAAGAVAAPALAPDDGIAAVLVDRLRGCGAGTDDTVVLAAAGSSDVRARPAVEETARRVAALWGAPVEVGCLGGTGEPLHAVLARSWRPGRRVVCAAMLMAPGFFHDRLRSAGADLVTGPLLDGRRPDPRLVGLVVERYEAALAATLAGSGVISG
ncbi:sirohydrochlorin chelatase [Polymorphospora lycopeni]|uniref:CbiX/SirB N-terminal domain-containing protein n=1 Tax=Polymorphospora lycopeni TaxID=3140240 RepID=A0ABV5CKV3_9ACTN